jgi:hypothetical protein
LPKGYGAFTYNTGQVPALEDVMSTGLLNPARNPKTSGYAQDLSGNYIPVAQDLHANRTAGYLDAQGEPLKTIPAKDYSAGEEIWQAKAAEEGTTPAQAQARAWINMGVETGLDSPPEPFIETFAKRIVATAEKVGKKPEEVLDDFIRGEAYLWSEGGIPKGGREEAPGLLPRA